MNAVLVAALVAGAVDPYYLIRSTSEPGHNSGRVMRGDWEAPASVLMTYEPEWQHVTAEVVRALDGAGVGSVLIASPMYPDDVVDSWIIAEELTSGVLAVVREPIDSAWVRDYGPLQVSDPHLGRVWIVARYESRLDDDALSSRVVSRFDVVFEEMPEAWDGGALISNGRGLCVTTEDAYGTTGISSATPAVVSSMLDQIGCRALVLLPSLRDDPTKHADMFAQFTSPERMIVAQIDPKEDADDAERMDEVAKRLRKAAQRLGMPLRIDRVPLPVPKTGLYLTYINGLSAGSAFLVPSYREAPYVTEMLAFDKLAEAMPGKDIIPIDADLIIPLKGAIHCILLGVDAPLRQETHGSVR